MNIEIFSFIVVICVARLALPEILKKPLLHTVKSHTKTMPPNMPNSNTPKIGSSILNKVASLHHKSVFRDRDKWSNDWCRHFLYIANQLDTSTHTTLYSI
jgi:hypothetical protein